MYNTYIVRFGRISLFRVLRAVKNSKNGFSKASKQVLNRTGCGMLVVVWTFWLNDHFKVKKKNKKKKKRLSAMMMGYSVLFIVHNKGYSIQ
jgi:UDP-N-acetylmuramyl pentapeptide phosphotransferase/UDP-N-acetylglucosamine-1-phosphate transferase